MRDTIEMEAEEISHVNQMELRLAGKPGGSHGRQARQAFRERRARRAQWWFQRMRRVVNGAMDWPSAPAARHEQVYLTLAGRRN